jgi:hypothetical protein
MILPEHLIQSMMNDCVECGAPFDPTDPPEGDHECRTLLTPADFHWVICGRCRGDGELGGWPGAFTQSDRDEWDYDDYENYRSYRRPCEDCGGTGKVRELTEEAENRPEVFEYLRDYYDTETIYRMERAMGA